MVKQAVLSTSIDFRLKEALTLFCKKKGLKIQSVVESAILEQLEDEMDLRDYHARKNEAEIAFKDVLKAVQAK